MYAEEVNNAIQKEVEWIEYLKSRMVYQLVGIDLKFEDWKNEYNRQSNIT